MSPEERYLFDLQGYLVVLDVLTREEVARFNELLDGLELWAKRGPVSRDHSNELKMHTGPVLEWGQEFRDLVSDRRLHVYLRELLGVTCRLDHEYAIFMKRGAGDLHLHGGATPYDPAQYYHFRNERMYNGLTVFSWQLTDSGGELGGFCGIPGSHKSNVRLPDDFRHFRKIGPWLQCPEAPAGSLVIFTEALTHGTMPWRADHERRSLLYKYSPGHQSWSKNLRPEFSLPMDEVGQALVRPPYHGRREPALPPE
jgi:hypothetical protein